MGKIAFVFSGQGAQHPGMGEAFYQNSDTVRALYDAAEALRPTTREMSFHGTDEDLKKTEHTQPCLYLADLAAALTLEEAGIHADAAAGFSLGELPALAFAGAFGDDLMTGFSVTAKRGALMGSVSSVDTAMYAVLKLKNETVEAICAAYAHITPVNYNAPGQLVISGDRAELALAAEDVKAAGGRALPLAVSGAFHSPYMNEAAEAFSAYLAGTAFHPLRMPVYANTTAMPYTGNVRETLSRQMNHPVLWEQTIRHMTADGITAFVECGVGSTLVKLISKIAPDAAVYRAETPEDIAHIKEELL